MARLSERSAPLQRKRESDGINQVSIISLDKISPAIYLPGFCCYCVIPATAFTIKPKVHVILNGGFAE
jgi:hypothetical protein